MVARPGRLIRVLSLVACLVAVAACSDDGPTAPSSIATSVDTSIDHEFTLRPGGIARVEDAGISVRFDGVSGDSRCPAGAFCVLGGDALVHVAVLDGSKVFRYELHTASMQPVRHGDLTLELVVLDPYPFSSITIEPWEYQATLRVTR